MDDWVVLLSSLLSCPIRSLGRYEMFHPEFMPYKVNRYPIWDILHRYLESHKSYRRVFSSYDSRHKLPIIGRKDISLTDRCPCSVNNLGVVVFLPYFNIHTCCRIYHMIVLPIQRNRRMSIALTIFSVCFDANLWSLSCIHLVNFSSIRTIIASSSAIWDFRSPFISQSSFLIYSMLTVNVGIESPCMHSHFFIATCG